MAMPLAEAARTVAKALREIKVDLSHCFRETLYEVGDSLVFYTPLKTGLASSNWNVTSGARVTAERKPISGEKGAASLEAIGQQISSIDIGQSAVFHNPVDYIEDLEKGTSRQAPAGMVTPTSLQIEDIWTANLKKYNLI